MCFNIRIKQHEQVKKKRTFFIAPSPVMSSLLKRSCMDTEHTTLLRSAGGSSPVTHQVFYNVSSAQSLSLSHSLSLSRARSLSLTPPSLHRRCRRLFIHLSRTRMRALSRYPIQLPTQKMPPNICPPFPTTTFDCPTQNTAAGTQHLQNIAKTLKKKGPKSEEQENTQ